MFTRNGLALLLPLMLVSNAFSQQAPELGTPVSKDELEALDATILPDGQGLPDGGGSAAEGAVVYQNHCFACHGPEGQEGINDRLAGGHGSLTGASPVKTVGSYWPYATTVFDYVRRAMPFNTPGVLTNDELYAVTAYLLYINDVIGANERIDALTLPAVRMPNRDNFVWDYPVDD